MSNFRLGRRGRPQEGAEVPLQIGPTGRDFIGGFTDAEVDENARKTGEASMLDPNYMGPNASDVWSLQEFVAALGVEANLIGHNMRSALASLYAGLEEAVTAVGEKKAAAKEAIDDHFDKAEKREDLSQKIKAEGLGFPHWVAHSLLYALALLGLVLGDLTFISVAYQLFGFSDARVFGIPYTDELHLAASTSVGGLVVLAHFAGKEIRGLTHTLARRRAAREEERESLPLISGPSVAMAVAYIIGAAAILAAISVIRADYLKALRTPVESLPFVAIQGGVFLAALGLAIGHAHPYGRQWVDIGRHATRTRKLMIMACAANAEAVAKVNATIDRGNAIIAGAGHHFGAARHNVIRQCFRWAWGVLKSVPEPVADERLLPKQLPLPAERSDAEVASFLVGITGLPKVERMTTDEVTAHREAGRLRIEKMRRRPRTAPAVTVPAVEPVWFGPPVALGSSAASSVAAGNGSSSNGASANGSSGNGGEH